MYPLGSRLVGSKILPVLEELIQGHYGVVFHLVERIGKARAHNPLLMNVYIIYW